MTNTGELLLRLRLRMLEAERLGMHDIAATMRETGEALVKVEAQLAVYHACPRPAADGR